jgi:RNA polymerase sigma factor (sigma-70 family)
MALLENDEIQNIFKENIHSVSTEWMNHLYFKLRPLVISRIKNFKTFLHVDDLEQEMNLALWASIKSFDCHKHFDFYRWSNWHFCNASRNFKKKYIDIKSINLEDKVIKSQEKIVLANQILNYCELNNKEREIIFGSFIEDKTLEAIGLELNMSIEGIRIIRNKAVIKIKNFVSEKG